MFLPSLSPYRSLWLSVLHSVLRVTSHPAPLALLAPAPTPRIKPIEPGLCILLRTVHIGSGLINWHNATTSTVHRCEHETTSNVSEICWQNVMSRSKLSTSVLLHEVLERWSLRPDNVVQFELLDLISGQCKNIFRQFLHDKTLGHPKGVWQGQDGAISVLVPEHYMHHLVIRQD